MSRKLSTSMPPASKCPVSKARLAISKTLRDEQQEHGESAGRKGAAEEDRIAEHPHLGDRGLADRQERGEHEELAEPDGGAKRQRRDALLAGGDAERDEQANEQREIEHQLESGRRLDHRE